MNGLPLPDRARWLLEACLRDDGRAIEAFGKWRRLADPDRMEGRELRLTPLLHENMRRLGLSDQRLAWIGGQAKHIWLTGVLRRRKLRSVLDLLEGAGVDFVLIKGAAMSARFPKAVGTRPMDGLVTPREPLAANFGGWGVRAEYIEALLTSEAAARLPTLDRLLPLGGPESDAMAWTGWGAPEGFGRWTVGKESRLRFRRPAERGEQYNAVAIDIPRFSARAGRSSLRSRSGPKRLAVFGFPRRPATRAAPPPAAS